MLDADELGSPDCTLIGADWHIPVHRQAFPDHPTTQKTASSSVYHYYHYTGFLAKRQGVSCRPAAVEGCHNPTPLLASPDPSNTQSTVGTVLSTYTAPSQPRPTLIADVTNVRSGLCSVENLGDCTDDAGGAGACCGCGASISARAVTAACATPPTATSQSPTTSPR